LDADPLVQRILHFDTRDVGGPFGVNPSSGAHDPGAIDQGAGARLESNASPVAGLRGGAVGLEYGGRGQPHDDQRALDGQATHDHVIHQQPGKDARTPDLRFVADDQIGAQHVSRNRAVGSVEPVAPIDLASCPGLDLFLDRGSPPVLSGVDDRLVGGPHGEFEIVRSGISVDRRVSDRDRGVGVIAPAGHIDAALGVVDELAVGRADRRELVGYGGRGANDQSDVVVRGRQELERHGGSAGCDVDAVVRKTDRGTIDRGNGGVEEDQAKPVVGRWGGFIGGEGHREGYGPVDVEGAVHMDTRAPLCSHLHTFLDYQVARGIDIHGTRQYVGVAGGGPGLVAHGTALVGRQGGSPCGPDRHRDGAPKSETSEFGVEDRCDLDHRAASASSGRASPLLRRMLLQQSVPRKRLQINHIRRAVNVIRRRKPRTNRNSVISG